MWIVIALSQQVRVSNKYIYASNYYFCLIGRMKRARCGSCKNCLNKNCGKCKHCLDNPKFGGFGRLKQSCIQRKCLNMKPKGIVRYLLINQLYEIVIAGITATATTNNTTTSTSVITKKEPQNDKETTNKSQESCQSSQNLVDITAASNVANSSKTGVF